MTTYKRYTITNSFSAWRKAFNNKNKQKKKRGTKSHQTLAYSRAKYTRNARYVSYWVQGKKAK